MRYKPRGPPEITGRIQVFSTLGHAPDAWITCTCYTLHIYEEVVCGKSQWLGYLLFSRYPLRKVKPGILLKGTFRLWKWSQTKAKQKYYFDICCPLVFLNIKYLNLNFLQLQCFEKGNSIQLSLMITATLMMAGLRMRLYPSMHQVTTDG